MDTISRDTPFRSVRLVTFLGTGDYKETTYCRGEETWRTPYMASAAVRFFGVNEVVVLATDEARVRHEAPLREAFTGLPPERVRFDTVPHGSNSDELWALFQALLDALAADSDMLIIDITHGFRSQPFFAAACVGYLQALRKLPDQVEVIYGAYEARAEDRTPVWRFTEFLELMTWASGVGTFVETGLADPLIETLRRVDDDMRRQLARQGEKQFPPTQALVKAIEQFTNDLTTLRIPQLLRGYCQGMQEPNAAVSSSSALLQAVDEYGQQSAAAIPALAPLLKRLRTIAKGLPITSLHGQEADQAMRRLAERYLHLRRYPEAAVVVREAHVSRYADSPAATEAGVTSLYSDEARAKAESRWKSQDHNAQTVANIRNDIEHAGFRVQPMDGKKLRKQIENLVSTLDTSPQAESPVSAGKVWFVSRHPGACAWLAAQGIQVDEQVEHLDPAQIREGDTIIGTLPVHLVADVCEKGATYKHLTLDLPPELRGRELDANTLEELGARLEQYCVRRVTDRTS